MAKTRADIAHCIASLQHCSSAQIGLLRELERAAADRRREIEIQCAPTVVAPRGPKHAAAAADDGPLIAAPPARRVRVGFAAPALPRLHSARTVASLDDGPIYGLAVGATDRRGGFSLAVISEGAHRGWLVRHRRVAAGEDSQSIFSEMDDVAEHSSDDDDDDDDAAVRISCSKSAAT